MKNTAIIYATISGSTRDLAMNIAYRLNIGRSHVFDLLETELASLPPYEQFLIGSPTYGRGQTHYLWKEGLQELQTIMAGQPPIGLFVMGDQKGHRKTFGGGLFRLYDQLDHEACTLIGGIPAFLYKHEFIDWDQSWLPGLLIDKHGPSDRNRVRMNTWLDRIRMATPALPPREESTANHSPQ